MRSTMTCGRSAHQTRTRIANGVAVLWLVALLNKFMFHLQPNPEMPFVREARILFYGLLCWGWWMGLALRPWPTISAPRRIWCLGLLSAGGVLAFMMSLWTNTVGDTFNTTTTVLARGPQRGELYRLLVLRQTTITFIDSSVCERPVIEVGQVVLRDLPLPPGFCGSDVIRRGSLMFDDNPDLRLVGLKGESSLGSLYLTVWSYHDLLGLSAYPWPSEILRDAPFGSVLLERDAEIRRLLKLP